MSATTVELLFFDGCPNHEQLEPRLRELLRHRAPDAALRLQRVETHADARRLRFLGSPSVRVDGRDVEPGADDRDDFGLNCRLYRVGDAFAGAPPDAWILAALTRPRSGLQRLTRRPIVDRLSDLPAGARALHRRVLLAFASGEPPGASVLVTWAGELGIDGSEALAELERRDVIKRDPLSGDVVVAYPFSARETAHHVELVDDGTRVYAMCAIDALGIPFMLRRAVRIASQDPETAEQIELAVAPDSPPPASQIVVQVRTSGNGRNCDCLCPHINFLAQRPGPEDETIVDLAASTRLAREIFGSLLDSAQRPMASE